MKYLTIALAVTVVSTVDTANAQDGGPAVSIGAIETKITKDDCAALAAKVMRSSGLTQNFDAQGQTVYGETDVYTGAIRCEAPNGLVVFFVAGPLSKQTDSIYKKLETAFKSALPN
jgi:hypothetical protein